MRDIKRRATPERRTKKASSGGNKALWRQLLVGFGLFAAIALLVTATWYFTRIESLQITEVAVVGGITIPHETIRKAGEEQLIGSYLRLVPKRFTWLYPKGAMHDAIAAIPRVKQVHLERDGQKITIAYDEFQPYALWCTSVGETNCLFIDREGYAFAEAPNLTGGAFVRYVTDDAPVLATGVGATDFLKETERFIEQAKNELGLFVTHVVKLGEHDIEYHVSGDGRIKVSQTMSGDTSFANLRTILSSEDFRHLEPGSFNYIDLRFGDKVFVNEVTEEIATSTATNTPSN